MYVFIFISTFIINFALYQAGPQNYANQGFEEKGPPSPQINYSTSTNDNKNRHEGENLYTKYFDGEKEVLNVGNGNNKKNVFYIGESPSVNSGSSINTDTDIKTNGNKNRYARQSLYTKYFDGEKEVLNVGNGNNKKNVFYIGESPSVNSESSINTDTYIERRPNNFNLSPANYYPNPQENNNLGNRFGSNEPRREITRINNIGNGMSNGNTFFINDHDGDETSVKVFSSSSNNNQRPNIQQRDYHLNSQRHLNQGVNFNNKGTTNIHTYTRIGYGPNNRNMVIMNGETIYRLGSGLSVTNTGRRGQGKRARGRSPMYWLDHIRTAIDTKVHDALHVATHRAPWHDIFRRRIVSGRGYDPQ